MFFHDFSKTFPKKINFPDFPDRVETLPVTLLTYFISLVSFYTSWKALVFWCFQGV